MTNGLAQTVCITFLYTLLIFLIAWYAHYRKAAGRGIVDNPYIYTLSIAVYCTSWTFFGSIGKAATTGIDYIFIYLGPSLAAFSWFFLLRRIVRISKENNISSVTDFISLRYGKSPWLGALVTIIATLGIMPYIALQLKAVSTSFHLMSGCPAETISIYSGAYNVSIPGGLFLAFILSVFGIMFGARRLSSSERHEGLIAAVAFESLVKLICLMGVGIFTTYVLHNGFSDVFAHFQKNHPIEFERLITIRPPQTSTDTIHPFTMLFMSMGAIMLLPRQFHVTVVENFDERHIHKAMWLFPLYLFLINLFIMPIALSGLLQTGGATDADFFILNIPLLSGNRILAALAYLGGLSAAAGMVMVESVTISTMLLNYIFMPVIVRFTPRPWFSRLLINLKRLGIILVIFLGYYYYLIAGDIFTLVNLGLFSFSAVIQFMPAMLGGLYWKRGNLHGAFFGALSGSLIWLYTLFIPSLVTSGWLDSSFVDKGPFGISLLKPTALFGLTGMDPWSHSLFWSMFFNILAYLLCSIAYDQNDRERDQVKKYFGAFEIDRRQRHLAETKRLSKPVTISQFVSLMEKFIGEKEARQAISDYIGNRKLDESGTVSEFELANLKRFTEKTLAGSVGAAAAGAIVDSFLSDMGSRMELVYDIFSTVRTSLDQSREALFVRLKASELINRTLDLQIIMDDLLKFLLREFKLDIALILLRDSGGELAIQSCHDSNNALSGEYGWIHDSRAVYDGVVARKKSFVVNDATLNGHPSALGSIIALGVASCAFIPVVREGESSLGILAVFSKNIPGLFTREFIELLESLAGQLAQAVTIAREIEARDRERLQKEYALLLNARINRDMEIAKQIQISLLPKTAPEIFGVELKGRCVSAAHVGGDYYDFFQRNEHTVDLIIADVSGHSVGAALIMAEARTLLRPQVNAAHNACSILKLLNSQLYDDLTRAELFITMFYAKYNSATGRLSYANAGHNRPLVCREGKTSCIELDAEGLIIGVKPSVIFEERSIELVKGDLVLFYTDGLVEAVNTEGEQFGVSRVCKHLIAFHHLPVEELIESVYARTREFTGSEALQDDITLVVLRIL